MSARRKERLTATWFLLPSFLGIIIFYILPYGICFVKSLYKGETFVGLGNYWNLLQNNVFHLALKNTGVFTVIAVPLLMVLSFLISLLLHSFPRISSLLKSNLLLPVVVPTTSMILVWQLFFDNGGTVNGILSAFGFSSIDFFYSEFSMGMIIFIYIWKYCGLCTLLFCVGLANVPKSLLETAKLDGASCGQIVRNVILPVLIPTIFLVFLMEMIYSFKIYREVFALFGEYPTESVYFVQNFINNNYYNLNYPQLATASILLSLLLVIAILILFRMTKNSNYLE